MDDLWSIKLALMGVTFLATTGAGLAPVLVQGPCGKRLRRVLGRSARSRILACASCFGAGVFLFVCFMGLLPAADAKFHLILRRLEEEGGPWGAFAEFPWGFFVVTCGFLSIFTIDKLAHAFEMGRLNKRKEFLSNTSPISSVTLLSVKNSPTGRATKGQSNDSSFQEVAHRKSISLEEYVVNSLKKQDQQEMYESNHFNQKKQTGEDVNLQIHHDLHQVLDSETCVILEPDTHSHGHGVPSSMVFLLALGLHSLFEGAAVGLQTEREKLLEFGVAVLVHEVVMALTFGLEVSRSAQLSRLKKVAYIVVFTASIPAGMALGAALQGTATQNREVVTAILEAFATGIFLHVIFIEILAKEFPDHHQNHHQTTRPVSDESHHLPRLQQQQDTSVQVSSGDKPAKDITSQVPGDSRPPQNQEHLGGPSHVCLIGEKILSICAGLLTMILLNVFMHAHEH